MRLHFDLALVRRLLEHSKAATERSPSLEQLYDGRFRRDSKDADLDNLTAGSLPAVTDVDLTRIPPGLWLVSDQNIYLMSNGQPPLLVDLADTRHVIATAAEVNLAATIDGWRELKRAAFGGDEGVVFLELPFVEGLIAFGRDRTVCLDLTPTQVEVLAPHPQRPAVQLAAPMPRRRTAQRRTGRA